MSIDITKLFDRIGAVASIEGISLAEFRFDYVNNFISEHFSHGGYSIKLGYDLNDKLAGVYLCCNFGPNSEDNSLCFLDGKYNLLRLYPRDDPAGKIESGVIPTACCGSRSNIF
ncbi:hypothetical protein J4230_04395 [Candidatus Woesearchaeota archaeon]|nr:hypothetical protein [Candidatus Woesearchaeota archaeon]